MASAIVVTAGFALLGRMGTMFPWWFGLPVIAFALAVISVPVSFAIGAPVLLRTQRLLLRRPAAVTAALTALAAAVALPIVAVLGEGGLGVEEGAAGGLFGGLVGALHGVLFTRQRRR